MTEKIAATCGEVDFRRQYGQLGAALAYGVLAKIPNILVSGALPRSFMEEAVAALTIAAVCDMEVYAARTAALREAVRIVIGNINGDPSILSSLVKRFVYMYILYAQKVLSLFSWVQTCRLLALSETTSGRLQAFVRDMALHILEDNASQYSVLQPDGSASSWLPEFEVRALGCPSVGKAQMPNNCLDQNGRHIWMNWYKVAMLLL